MDLIDVLRRHGMLRQVDTGQSLLTITKALGKYLQEASVLVLVFGFLDPLVFAPDAKTLGDRFNAIQFGWAVLIGGFSLVFLASGVLLEIYRGGPITPPTPNGVS